jgi:hypothetical protein
MENSDQIIADSNVLEMDIPFINFVKERLTESQQILFVNNYIAYLNYDQQKDFIIQLDDKLSEKFGHSNIINAKKALEEHFEADLDYVVQGDNNGKQNILLNIQTFKQCFMMANTMEAKEFRTYYSKLSHVFFEYMSTMDN